MNYSLNVNYNTMLSYSGPHPNYSLAILYVCISKLTYMVYSTFANVGNIIIFLILIMQLVKYSTYLSIMYMCRGCWSYRGISHSVEFQLQKSLQKPKERVPSWSKVGLTGQQQSGSPGSFRMARIRPGVTSSGMPSPIGSIVVTGADWTVSIVGRWGSWLLDKLAELLCDPQSPLQGFDFSF
jgi:hypothetical protein